MMPFPEPQRRRAACDGCRLCTDTDDRVLGDKKLRCTGEVPVCLRCERMSITCVYSLRKQMGRPKKKRCRYSDASLSPPIQSSTDQASDTRVLENASAALGTPGALLGQNAWDIADFDYPLTIPDSLDMQEPHASDAHSADTPSWEASMHGRGFQAPFGGLGTSRVDGLFTHSEMENGHLPLQQHNVLPAPQLCACISAMYLALDDLNKMQDFSFPFGLHKLRKAINTGWDVIRCEHCPTLFLTAMQNVQLLGLLLVSLAERYNKIQEAVGAERQRCEATGVTKTFRVVDVSLTNAHLHTGDLDCPASFTIELQPSEWYAMAMKVLKTEIHGKDEQDTPALMGLIHSLEERQRAWHVTHPAKDAKEVCRGQRASGQPTCLMLVVEAKRLLASMEFD